MNEFSSVFGIFIDITELVTGEHIIFALWFHSAFHVR